MGEPAISDQAAHELGLFFGVSYGLLFIAVAAKPLCLLAWQVLGKLVLAASRTYGRMMDKPWPRWAIWTGMVTFLASLAVGIAGVILGLDWLGVIAYIVFFAQCGICAPRKCEMWSEIRRVWRPVLYYLEELALWTGAGVLWYFGHGWWALIPGVLAFAPTVWYAWRWARG